MEFKKDFKIKPKEVKLDGSVIFTDGTNNVVPNQLACEAYGYKYDAKTGTCTSFVRKKKLDQVFDNLTNKIQGENNKIQYSTHNTSITGRNNVVNGENDSCSISGTSNVIDLGINNSLLIGKMGKVTHDNEFCIGAGGFNSEAGLLQYSVLQVSGKTTSTADVDLNIEGDATGTEITLPANSVTTYEIWLSGLVTGGSSGTAGHYDTYEYHGTIRCADDGTLTHNAKIARLLGRTGGLGTKTIDTATAYTLKIQITGQNNVNTQWHAVVKLHTNKTNAVTF